MKSFASIASDGHGCKTLVLLSSKSPLTPDYVSRQEISKCPGWPLSNGTPSYPWLTGFRLLCGAVLKRFLRSVQGCSTSLALKSLEMFAPMLESELAWIKDFISRVLSSKRPERGPCSPVFTHTNSALDMAFSDPLMKATRVSLPHLWNWEMFPGSTQLFSFGNGSPS